jgi:hypothetical protein
VQHQCRTEYRTVKVHFIVFVEFVLREYELHLLSEAVKVTSPEEVQVLKVDVLEQDHHTQA